MNPTGRRHLNIDTFVNVFACKIRKFCLPQHLFFQRINNDYWSRKKSLNSFFYLQLRFISDDNKILNPNFEWMNWSNHLENEFSQRIMKKRNECFKENYAAFLACLMIMLSNLLTSAPTSWSTLSPDFRKKNVGIADTENRRAKSVAISISA